MKQRADGRWLKVVAINGKRKYFYSSEPTEKKAIKDINRQMIEYTEKEVKGSFFKDVAAEWERVHYPKIEYSTMTRYKTYVSFAVDYFADFYIKEITAENIQSFLNGSAESGRSTKTIKDQMSVLRMIFKYAVIKQYISNNPTLYITPPKGNKSLKRNALTAEQVKRVEQSIDKPFGLLAYFLLYTGLRKGELLALQYKDIDFEKKIITIDKSVYLVGNRPHLKATKTAAGTRKVILLDCLAEKLPKRNNPDEYVFPGVDGGAMPGSFFTRHWRKWQKASGLDVTAHQLRHTYATILYEAGVNVKDAQSLMGHSDISVTQNIYTHIRETHMNNTANKLNKFINT